MSKLVIDVVFPAAPVTTLLKRIVKGVEQLYYCGLFTQSLAYEQASVWSDWLEIGFHVAVVTSPPGTLPQDKSHLSVLAPAATPVLTVAGGNKDALANLQSLLSTIESQRASLHGLDEGAKAESLASGPLGPVLFLPTLQALQRAGLSQRDVERYQTALRRGVLALAHENIKAMVLNLS